MTQSIARNAILVCFIILFLGCASVNATSLYPSSIKSQLQDADRDGVINSRDLCPDTPQGSAIDNEGCALTNTVYHSVRFQAQFDTNQYQLDAPLHGQLAELADTLHTYPDSLIFIEGHTDRQGSPRYNLRLSKKRADALAALLVTHFQIAPTRIIPIGYGQQRPIAADTGSTDTERNRRVVARILTPTKGDTTTSWRLPFKLNQYRVSEQQKALLQPLVLRLIQQPEQLVLIEGHTDASGQFQHNMRLSQQRAEQVAGYLEQEHSINEQSIMALGYGANQPFVDNDTAYHRQQNRRVEVRLLEQLQVSQQVILPKWTIWSVDELENPRQSN
ncbi:OmpA family protein [Marinomonas sp. TW1]|uniref:OmpA family protein n=1 Tax=Marinomonas sp. TW1 TaxID=1561203 RepID=UPI0009EE0646|nr:OmpA family protein [Marinomonas sp. TW1]